MTTTTHTPRVRVSPAGRTFTAVVTMPTVDGWLVRKESRGHATREAAQTAGDEIASTLVPLTFPGHAPIAGTGPIVTEKR